MTQIHGLDSHQIELRLNTLHARLASIEEALSGPLEGDRAGNHFGAVVLAATAWRDFLKGIPTFSNVLSPLEMLIAALNDVQSGAQPDIFKFPATRGRKTPTKTEFLKVRTVDAVELLRAAGASAEEARSTVSKLWTQLDIRQDTAKEISPDLIEEWEGWLKAFPVGTIMHSHSQLVKRTLASRQWTLSEAVENVRAFGKEIALHQTWQDRLASRRD